MRQNEQTAARSRSFGEISEDYERYRPGPPVEAVEWLLPPDATDVLEIGAGTGALTRLLVNRVDRVVAVEPDARMRAICEARVPRADIRAATAEDLPVEDASVDAVFAASAWHWVDESKAVPEVARVLRPGGQLSLLWSGPDRTIDWMRSLWAGGDEQSFELMAATESQRKARHVVSLGDDAPFGESERRLINWTLPMSKDELVGLVGTYSMIITQGAAERRAYLATIAAFLDTHESYADADVIDIPMRCFCWRAART